MKQALSSFFGLVLSIITLFPFLISSSATLQHFYFVFSVSLFTLAYLDMQFFQKVDFPDPGLPTKITIYFSTQSTFLFPQMSSPFSGTLVGLKPFTSILSTYPKNRFSGVLKSIPTLRANFKSESEKSLCFPSLRPAASPQKKLLALFIFIPPLFFYKHSHIFPPGFLYQSSWAATNTCISTPISLAMSFTLILMSDAFVCPFCMPAWLVKMTILYPQLESSLILGFTLSLRSIQSQASLGNLAPLFLVMIVSSMSNEAIASAGFTPEDDPIRQVFSSLQLQSSPFLSLSLSTFFSELSSLFLGGISQKQYEYQSSN